MTKLDRTIDILKRGWTTSLECAQQGGVMSLSQRVNLDLRPMMTFEFQGKWLVVKDVPRFDIEERWQTTAGGARVKAWRITTDRAAP